jgi:predicted unusual protein kinase regulating ubiquinone biosynthesis (AarF/ABC1/UbiB family)
MMYIVTVATALLVCAILWWCFGRRNRAGIATAMSARTAQMGTLVTRSLLRKLRLRVHQLLVRREHRKQLEDEYHIKTAAEAAVLMGNMKGLFMKLGQIVSFAVESLPPAARQALQGLQNAAPPMDFSLARQVIESELGGDLSRFFKHVDEQPLAAASIGQVHQARLCDGTHVVIKVQYPGVDQAIRADLKFSGGMAAMISAVHKNADAKAVMAELRARVLDELDYRKEAANQQLFYDLWHGHPLIHIPRVHTKYSARRVLCQEYRRGLGFYDFLAVATPAEKRMAAFVLNDFVFDSMHLFHVFNGDPHPGNYLFQEDGGITFLDFGCIKYFAPGFIGDLQGLNRALVEEDLDAFDRYVHELRIILPGRPYDREMVWEFFCYHAAPFARDREFEFTDEYMNQASEVMQRKNLDKLNLPPELLFFNRITFGLNSIFKQLSARANWHRHYRRYLDRSSLVPPSLAMHGVALPERFLRNDVTPVTPPRADTHGSRSP